MRALCGARFTSLGVAAVRRAWQGWSVFVVLTLCGQALAAPDHYARCAACHLADGAGVPGMFPPLTGHVRRFFGSPEGRGYLGRLVLGGANGAVEVHGVHYAGVMPAVVADLSNAEVADLLNELVRRYGSPESTLSRSFSAEEVAKARAAGALSGAERVSLRQRALAEANAKAEAEAEAEKATAVTHPVSVPSAPADPALGALQARQDWMLHCQGCHGGDGALSTPGMAALRGQVARYLRMPGGRTRLVQVPGVANAWLSDARVAGTLNWMLETFDGEHLPDDFEAFTGDEVGALRRRPPGKGAGHAVRESPERGIATHPDE